LERLRHIREQAGYSQQELADESGVSQHTISEIELGRRKPQGRTLRKLAKVLGVEVRDFFGELDSPLGQALPEREYGAILEELGFPPEQIESWRTQEGRDNEAIARELETMSAKDFLEEQVRTSPYLRKYYHEAHKDEAAPSSTQPPLNGFEEERRDTPDWVLGLPDKQFDAWLQTAALPEVNEVMSHISKAAQTATGEDRAVVLSRAMRILRRFTQLAGPFSEALIPAYRRRGRPTEREEGREAG
jgi:transcriptional regulator with XRE-family HTH domain